MKDIRPALRALLLSDPTVNGLVGGNRIYPSRVPQGVRDGSLVYTRIDENSDVALSGGTGLETILMQLDSWAESADETVSLGNAVYDVLMGFKGDVSYGSNSPQNFVT